MQNNWWKIALVLAAILIIAAFVAPRKLNEYYTTKAMNASSLKEVERLAEKALIFSKSNPLTYHVLGEVALGDNEIIRGNPNYPDADWEKAIKYYEKAFLLGLEQKYPGKYNFALSALGSAHEALGQNEEAAKKYLEQVDKFPQASFKGRYFAASLYYNKLDRPQDAIGVLLPAFTSIREEDKAMFSEAYALSSILYLYFDKYVEAEEHARHALKSSRPDMPDSSYTSTEYARRTLIFALGAQKKFSEAEKEAAAWNATMAGGADCALASAYMRGGSYSKAINMAKSVKKETVHPYSYISCLYTLAKSFIATNNISEAKKYINDYMQFSASGGVKNSSVLKTQREFTKFLESH